MLKLAKQYGLRHALFIADRGYFSNKIIDDIMKNFDGFILMEKTNNKMISNIIEDNKNIAIVPNYIDKYGVYGIKRQERLFKQDLDCEKNTFIYFLMKRYIYEKENLIGVANKNYIEGKEQIGKNRKEIDIELYPYCIFQIEDGIIKEAEFNQELFDDNLKRSGYFVIVSSLDEEPSKIIMNIEIEIR